MPYRVEGKTLKRSSFEIGIQPNGKDKRRLNISFSSETPYLRHNPETGERFWEVSKGSGTGLSAFICGSWKELLIGQWGGIDIITDEMTEAAKGNVRIVAHSEWDISV